MDNKEQINTLITTGVSLPAANPYLDDSSTASEDEGTVLTKKRRGKTKNTPTKESVPVKTTLAPDPKEYIAELERPEEDLF